MKTRNYLGLCAAVSLIVVVSVLFLPGVAEAIESALLTFLSTNAR